MGGTISTAVEKPKVGNTVNLSTPVGRVPNTGNSTVGTGVSMRRNNENNLRGGKRTKKQKRKGGKKSRCWSRRA
jgi:hypothetical protein